MTIARFETASLIGVKSAFKKHYSFMGGMSLGHAPEAFIQGEIACALAKVAQYVTLESGVQMLLREAGAELRGKKPRNGRIDIAAWWADGRPRFVIEIKKVYSHDSINADVKRLRQVLRRGGSCSEGLVVVYSDAKRKETLEKRFKSVEKVALLGLSARVQFGTNRMAISNLGIGRQCAFASLPKNSFSRRPRLRCRTVVVTAEPGH